MPTYPQKPAQLKGLIKSETEAVFWAPLTLELSILGKFLADEIKKLPAEAIPVAVALVEAAIPGVEATAVATREGFSQVPLPKPQAALTPNPTPAFFQPVNPALTDTEPFTNQWIKKQATMLRFYFLEAMAAE